MRLVSAVIVVAIMSAVLAQTAGPARADPAPADPEPAEIIGILHVETEGVSEAAAAAFERAIDEAIRSQGLAVAPRERLAGLLLDSAFVEGCLFGPCLQPIHRLTEVRLVLVARIVATGSTYSLAVSLMDTRTGQPASQVAEECSVCTLEEAVSSVTLAVIALVTGTGAARGRAAGGEPTQVPDLEAMQRRIATLEDRTARGHRTLRRGALFFGGAAIIAGASAGYLLGTDRDGAGAGAAGAAGAFALTGATMLVLSQRF